MEPSQPAPNRWIVSTAMLALGALSGFALARSTSPSTDATRIATYSGYQQDDPAQLQPTMRAIAVAMLSVQAHLDRGFTRPAEPHARAIVDSMRVWSAAHSGQPMDPHRYGRRFEEHRRLFIERAEALLRATQADDVDDARLGYVALVTICITCHHDGERGAHVSFGRLALQ
ncbi:MAG: hypothetical protein U0269_31810 [Polyangiales bacterium]